MKFIIKIFGGFLLLGAIVMGYLFIFGTTDLRTETAKLSPNKKDAKVLLQEMAKAHGTDNWEGVETYSVNFQDQFFGVLGNMSHPFEEDSIRLLLNYIPKTYDGSMEILTGIDEGETWGIQSWKTYVNHPSLGTKFEENKDIIFWLPTYQYFIEFPFRIQKADALAYAGEATFDGKICDGVLASWNTIDPQKEIDQYLVWIDREDKTIVKLEYTIREMYNFIKGAVYFQDYVNFDGILLPSKMPVESNLLEDGFLHEMQILSFSKNQIPVKKLRPNKALKIIGDDKI